MLLCLKSSCDNTFFPVQLFPHRAEFGIVLYDFIDFL